MASSYDPDSPGTNIISVPHLRSASVSAPGYGFDLVGNFDAPSLTDLRLNGYRDFVPDSMWDADGDAGDDANNWRLDLAREESDILTHLSARTPNIRCLELRYIRFEHPKDWSYLLSGHTLPALEELILERTNISNFALICSAGLSKLKKLRLCDCRYVSLKGLRRFVQGRAGLEFALSVERCPAISREEVKALSKFVPVEWK